MSHQYETLLNVHKKNLEAISDASRAATEVVQSLGKLQAEYMQQTMTDVSQMMSEVSKDPKEAIKMPFEKAKEMMARTNAHGSDVVSALMNAQREATQTIQEHCTSNFEQFKAASSKYKN